MLFVALLLASLLLLLVDHAGSFPLELSSGGRRSRTVAPRQRRSGDIGTLVMRRVGIDETEFALSETTTGALEDAEAAAMALSSYMAKAHVEKLKAIQRVEAQNREEIAALKDEVERLKQQQRGGGGGGSITTTTTSTSTDRASAASSSSSPSSLALMLAQYRQNDPIRTRALEDLTKEELMGRILQYQDQMQSYMVKSLQERQKAVTAARATAQQQLKETLQLLAVAGAEDPLLPVAAAPLYEARNAAVGRAAGAGRSRWIASEIVKVTTNAPIGRLGATTVSTKVVGAVDDNIDQKKKKSSPRILPSSRAVLGGGAAPPAKIDETVVVVIPDDVIAAADHGMRADGGVTGPSLAERLAYGSNPMATTAPPAAASPSLRLSSAGESEPLPHFAMRVAKVQAAASQNKSRWGAQEVNRLSGQDASVGAAPSPKGIGSSKMPNNVVVRSDNKMATLNGAVMPPPSLSTTAVLLETVAAADHGLRADGGVGGLTLLERVTMGAKNTGTTNVGAQIVQTLSSSSSSAAAVKSSSLYGKRNAKVNAAPAAKSRWGAPERRKIQNAANIGTLTTLPPGSSSVAPVVSDSLSVVVAAADHGLRADGGVGGPTLAERLNFGAALVAAAASASVASDGSGSSLLYEMRSAKVTKALDKSRWGKAEIRKIALSSVGSNDASPASTAALSSSGHIKSAATVVLAPSDANAVQDADHGMRADGGVGGPTLAERVAAGPTTMNGTLQHGVASSSSLYDRRNAKVQAAAAAGKAVRWGGKEMERIQIEASSTASLGAGQQKNGNRAPVVVAPVPRVNFGANLVLNR